MKKQKAAQKKREKTKKSKVVAHKLFVKMNSKDPATRMKARTVYKKIEKAPPENKDAQAVKQMVKAEASEELAERSFEEEKPYEEEEEQPVEDNGNEYMEEE